MSHLRRSSLPAPLSCLPPLAHVLHPQFVREGETLAARCCLGEAIRVEFEARLFVEAEDSSRDPESARDRNLLRAALPSHRALSRTLSALLRACLLSWQGGEVGIGQLLGAFHVAAAQLLHCIPPVATGGQPASPAEEEGAEGGRDRHWHAKGEGVRVDRALLEQSLVPRRHEKHLEKASVRCEREARLQPGSVRASIRQILQEGFRRGRSLGREQEHRASVVVHAVASEEGEVEEVGCRLFELRERLID
mmetsp:Transcript_17307/g.41713  ORF Transcript_17307/g.41713 Transcript_17307/m.41713 type:complete len:250 (-) Transcript_17307:861-1610(-)